MDLVKESLIKAAVATALVISIGFVAGMQMDDARTGFLEEQIRESNLRSETFMVTQNYLEESSQNYCRVVRGQIPRIARENAQIGRDLQSFSGRSMPGKDFSYLKEKYYVNQLRLYNILRGFRNRCNSNVTLIFFFFDSSIDSQRQGAVLTEYRTEVDNRTHVFSYNLNTGNSTVMDILKTDYNVTEGPTIVVNGDRTFRGYVSLKELKRVLDE